LAQRDVSPFERDPAYGLGTHHPKFHLLDRRAHRLVGVHLHPEETLSAKEGAARLDVSVQFLEIGRTRGYGPKFVRIAKRLVRYRVGDVLDWLKSRTRACTSECSKGAVSHAASKHIKIELRRNPVLDGVRKWLVRLNHGHVAPARQPHQKLQAAGIHRGRQKGSLARLGQHVQNIGGDATSVTPLRNRGNDEQATQKEQAANFGRGSRVEKG
jgi:hypothetical protein